MLGRFPCVLMGRISIPSDPVPPNAIFCSPVYKFVHFMFLLAFCCDHRRQWCKVTVEFCVRLVCREQADMKYIMDLHYLRECQAISVGAYPF
jgi:hypothetical protein